jgi:hypothetical protein
LTADLIVPTFTRNVKVGQPRLFGKKTRKLASEDKDEEALPGRAS